MSIKKKLQAGFTLVELMIVVAIIGILAVLAVYGVKKYIANAKTAEARQNLGRIGKDAASAYEAERMDPTLKTEGTLSAVTRDLCAAEVTTIPDAIPVAQKYQSKATDWTKGVGKGSGGMNIGFACLRFELNTPQYYAYGYKIPAAGEMSATAEGDLDGNGINSKFDLKGKVDTTTKRLRLAPQLIETNPDE